MGTQQKRRGSIQVPIQKERVYIGAYTKERGIYRARSRRIGAYIGPYRFGWALMYTLILLNRDLYRPRSFWIGAYIESYPSGQGPIQIPNLLDGARSGSLSLWIGACLDACPFGQEPICTPILCNVSHNKSNASRSMKAKRSFFRLSTLRDDFLLFA